MHEDWRQQPYRYEKSETCGARSTHGQILGILIHLEVGRNWIMDLVHVIIHYLFVERENFFDQQIFGKRMFKGRIFDQNPWKLRNVTFPSNLVINVEDVQHVQGYITTEKLGFPILGKLTHFSSHRTFIFKVPCVVPHPWWLPQCYQTWKCCC